MRVKIRLWVRAEKSSNVRKLLSRRSCSSSCGVRPSLSNILHHDDDGATRLKTLLRVALHSS